MRQVPRFTICSLRCGRQEGKVVKILVVISFNLSSSPGQLGAISKNNSNGITLGIYIYMREFALLPWSSLAIDHSTLHRFGCLMMVSTPDICLTVAKCFKYSRCLPKLCLITATRCYLSLHIQRQWVFCQLEGLILWLVCHSYQSGSFL